MSLSLVKRRSLEFRECASQPKAHDQWSSGGKDYQSGAEPRRSKGSADLSDFAEALGLHPPNAATMCGVRITSRSCRYSSNIPNPNQSGKKSQRISPCRL